MKSQGKTPIPTADAYKPSFYFTDKSYYYLNVKAKATQPNLTWAGSVLWPKPSSTDCLHPQDRAPGSGSPLALRQGSCNFSQTLFSTLCFHFTAKCPETQRLCHSSSHVCSTKLTVSHTEAKCEGDSGLHRGPQPFQTVHYLENKGRKWQSSSVRAAFGELTQACSLCDCTWQSSPPGLPAAKADLGTPPARHHGQARGCTPLPALSSTDTARSCSESQGTPTLLWTTNTKMLHVTSKQLLCVLNVKHKYSDLGVLITFLYFNMTRFLKFTHNSAYPWVWRQLQYPYNTQP